MTTIIIERDKAEQALRVLLRFPVEKRTVWKDGIDLALPTWEGEKHEQAIADIRAALAAPATAPDELERLRKDSERLDFLDINQHWRMGWTVGRSPVGNISVTAVAQLNGATTSIREAIDAAMKGTP